MGPLSWARKGHWLKKKSKVAFLSLATVIFTRMAYKINVLESWYNTILKKANESQSQRLAGQTSVYDHSIFNPMFVPTANSREDLLTDSGSAGSVVLGFMSNVNSNEAIPAIVRVTGAEPLYVSYQDMSNAYDARAFSMAVEVLQAANNPINVLAPQASVNLLITQPPTSLNEATRQALEKYKELVQQKETFDGECGDPPMAVMQGYNTQIVKLDRLANNFSSTSAYQKTIERARSIGLELSPPEDGILLVTGANPGGRSGILVRGDKSWGIV